MNTDDEGRPIHTYFASIFVLGNVIYVYELHVGSTNFQRHILCQKWNLLNWIKNGTCGAHLSRQYNMMVLEQLQCEPRLFLAPKCSKIFEFGSLFAFFFVAQSIMLLLTVCVVRWKNKALKADNDTHRSERRN